MKRGKYKLKRRAERQEETRLRIVRAAMELHERLGPSRTTISAVAERAGVGRPTVYSHFPDELSLFKGCSSLDLSENPPPDPDPWAQIVDPEERLRAALAELYTYFRCRERMLSKVLRDAEGEAEVSANLREVLKPLFGHWNRMKDILAAGWEVPNGQPQALLVEAGVGLALNFQSWRTIVRQQNLTDEQAVELMTTMVRCVAREDS